MKVCKELMCLSCVVALTRKLSSKSHKQYALARRYRYGYGMVDTTYVYVVLLLDDYHRQRRAERHEGCNDGNGWLWSGSGFPLERWGLFPPSIYYSRVRSHSEDKMGMNHEPILHLI